MKTQVYSNTIVSVNDRLAFAMEIVNPTGRNAKDAESTSIRAQTVARKTKG